MAQLPFDPDTATDEELADAEREILRELARGDGTSFSQRQRLAFAFIRTVVERSVRENERRVGARHPRS